MKKISCTLLVDDDDATNFINQSLLEDLGVTEQVLVAHNGREALELLQQRCVAGNCPELILLDVNMPVMNGFEFLEAYEQLQFAHKQSVVVVMLTTSLNPNDVSRIREGEIASFLNKPLTQAMVNQLFHEYFDL